MADDGFKINDTDFMIKSYTFDELLAMIEDKED